MTNTFITGTATLTQLMNGDDVTFVSGGVRTTDMSGFSITGTNNALYVDGFIHTLGSLGMNVTGQITLTVGAEGLISQSNTFGGTAVYVTSLDSATDIRNFGTISGNFGIYFDGDDVGNTLQNYGTISSLFPTSLGAAVSLDSSDNVISNFGIITAALYGVVVRSDATGNTIFNQGSISGEIGIGYIAGSTTAIENFGVINGFGGNAIEIEGSGGKIRNFDIINGDIDAGLNGNNMVVVNYGTVNGDILLGNGTDKYFGRGDSEVAGAVRGGSGADTLDGGNGADYLYGDQGNDLIRAGDGDDVLNGSSGVETIKGNAGRDAINGGDNSDFLFGGADADTIKGGNGNDRIMGGRGDDVMTGNAGADIFIFQRYTDDDVITDFQNNVDKLDLSAYNVNSRNELFSKGGIFSDGSGSIIDLTVVGGDGIIMVEDMSVSDWSASDFIF
uniref:calcium-binding protein n=1 Tax=Yoonia sp. TaxID=2212373 RepID=UPI004047A236